jgi:hypothetical protein
VLAAAQDALTADQINDLAAWHLKVWDVLRTPDNLLKKRQSNPSTTSFTQSLVDFLAIKIEHRNFGSI